jgi:hypothetical protein
VIGRSLVVNVPGSPRAAVESLAAIEPTLGHALETLAGPYEHDTEAAEVFAPRADEEPIPSATTAAARAPSPEDDETDAPTIPPGDPSDPWRDLPKSPA